MSTSFDFSKRREWEQRLARFRVSGGSVGRFCEAEKVSVNTYYYWKKRLAGQRPSPMAMSLPATNDVHSQGCDPASERVPMVYFQWASGLRVSVPASCFDAIRCLVTSTSETPSDSRHRFHQVVMSTSSKARE